MPRQNKLKTTERRPIVSDLPGAAEARTDAFRSDLYLARLRLEAEEQQKEARRKKNKERGALESDDDASADSSTASTAAGPPAYLLSATRFLSCPSCSQRMDETDRHRHDVDSQYNSTYAYGGDDSQAMFDDSQHFMDTEEQIAREEESAARHRARAGQYPHMANLGRRSLLISSKCGHMFCTECWEREKKEYGGAGGDDGNDDKCKIPCPICLVPTPSTSVGKLRVNGDGGEDALMGPMSAMGAVLLRGMMMSTTMRNNADGNTGGTISRDDVRNTVGKLVPGTNWRKIGKKRRSDAYVDMTSVTEAVYQDLNKTKKKKKKKKGRPTATNSGNGRGPSVLPLAPIKEESQSQIIPLHRDGDGSMEGAVGEGLERADGPATDTTDGMVPIDGRSEDIGKLSGKDDRGQRTDIHEKFSADRESQAPSTSETRPTVAPMNAASAAGSAKATSSIGDRKPSTSTDLLAPKGSRSRIIDPGPSKKRGRMKRRKAGAGLNLRKNKAKALEESLSFHGSQSQASSVSGSQSTAGSPPEKKPSAPATGNDFSFRSESSTQTSQEEETPVPADGNTDAEASGSQGDGRCAKKQRIDESTAKDSAEEEALSDYRKPSASMGAAEFADTAQDDKDNSMTTPGSKRKHKHTIFETIEEVDDEIIEFTGTDGKVEKRRIDRSHEIIPVNTLVRVANRTFPGSNKLGGTAMIKKSRGSVADNTLVYDIVFVLGGRDTNIPYVYVVRDDAFSDADDEPRATPGSRRRSTRAGRSSSVKTQRPTSSDPPSTRRRSPRSRQGGIEDAAAAPRYTEVEEDEDEDDEKNDYEEVEAQDDGGREESSQRQLRAGTAAASGGHAGGDEEEDSDEETKADDLDLSASQIGVQQSPAPLPYSPAQELPRADTSSSAPAQLCLNMSMEGHGQEMEGEGEFERRSEIAEEEEEQDSQTQLPPQPEDSDETAKPQTNGGVDVDDDSQTQAAQQDEEKDSQTQLPPQPEDSDETAKPQTNGGVEFDDDSQTQAPPHSPTNDEDDEPSESPALFGPASHADGTVKAKRFGSTKTPIGTDLRCVAKTTRATDKTKRDAPASPIAGAARNLDSKFVATGDNGITWKAGDTGGQDGDTNADDRSVDSDGTEEVPATEMQKQSQESELSENEMSPDLLKQTEPQLSPALFDNRQSPRRHEEDDGRERGDSCSEVPATEVQGYSQGSPESPSQQQSQVFYFSNVAPDGHDRPPSTPSRPEQQQQLPPRGNHYSPSQESLHSQDPYVGREPSEPSEMHYLPSQAPSQPPINPSSAGAQDLQNSPVASPDRSQGSVEATGAYSPTSPGSPEDSLDRHLNYLEHGTQTESQIEPSQHHPNKSRTRFSSLKKNAPDRRGLHVEFDMTAKQSTAKKLKSAMGNPDTPATGYSTTTDTSTVLINDNVDDDALQETEEILATEPPPGYYESEVQRDRTDLQADESEFPATQEEVPATEPPPGYYESQIQRDRTELRVDDESQFQGDGTEEIPATLPPPGYEESQVQRDQSELRVEESQFHEGFEGERNDNNDKKRKREACESGAYDSDADEEEVPSSVPQSLRYSSSMPMADSEFASLALKTKEGLARRADRIVQHRPMKLRRVSEAVARGNSDDDTDGEEEFECELRLPSQDNLLVPAPSRRASTITTSAAATSTKAPRPLIIICHPQAMTEDEQCAMHRLQNELGLFDITNAIGNYNDVKEDPGQSFFVVHTRSMPLLDGTDGSNDARVCDRSLEYLLALASGSSIISADWLVNCNRKNRWLDPEPFAAWGDSRSYARLKDQHSPLDWLISSFKGAGVCSRSPMIRALIERGTLSPLLSSFAVIIVPTNSKAQSRSNNGVGNFELTTEQLRQLTLAHGGTAIETGEEQLWRKPLSSTKGIIIVPNSLERCSHDAISSFLMPWMLMKPSIIPDTAKIELCSRSDFIEEVCSTQQSQTTSSQDRGGFNKLPIIRARWLEDSAAALRRAPLKDYCLGYICLGE